MTRSGQVTTPGRSVRYAGGCHCGRVRFEVDAEATAEILECDCSMCSRTGFLHLIVAREQFRLLAGADDLVTYTFNTGTARHYFCGTCGVKSFYVPRSHPDGYSVNARCIEGDGVAALPVRRIDGRNWERTFGG